MTRIFDDAAIRALDLKPEEIVDALEAAYAERAAGRVSLVTKFGFTHPDGGFRHAMPVEARGLSAVKWVVSGDGSPGSKYINATLVVSHARTGATLAVMEAEWLTALRTAAVTAVALRRLPARTRETILFFGCGVQARIHAEFLKPWGFKRAYAVGRSESNRRRFVEELRAAGMQAEEAASADAILPVADVVVSSITLDAGTAPSLDARRLRPGSFAASIDLGKPWFGVDAFGYALTDDKPHAAGLRGGGHLAFEGVFDADLADMIAGRAPPIPSEARVYMVAPGNALSDAALARLVLDRSGIAVS